MVVNTITTSGNNDNATQSFPFRVWRTRNVHIFHMSARWTGARRSPLRQLQDTGINWPKADTQVAHQTPQSNRSSIRLNDAATTKTNRPASQYFKYIFHTSPIVFTISSTVRRVKFHLFNIIVTKLNKFSNLVILASASQFIWWLLSWWRYKICDAEWYFYIEWRHLTESTSVLSGTSQG